MRRLEALAALLLSAAPARADYRETGRVDRGGSRRTVVTAAAHERVDVRVRAAGFTPRLVVTGADGATVASSVGETGELSVVLPRAGDYALTVAASDAPGSYELALTSRLAARPRPSGRWLAAGGGFGERGATAVAAGELALGPLVASARGEFGDGWEVTALAGLRPGTTTATLPPQVERDAVCVDDGCWATANRVRFRAPRPTAARPFGVLGGVRAGRGGFSELTRVSAVIAGRWYHGRADRASFSRDIVELGVTQLLSGRDRPFLRHASFMPGWYLLAQRQWGVVPIVIGAELGITGLARRDASASLEPELYARCQITVPLDL